MDRTFWRSEGDDLSEEVPSVQKEREAAQALLIQDLGNTRRRGADKLIEIVSRDERVSPMAGARVSLAQRKGYH